MGIRSTSTGKERGPGLGWSVVALLLAGASTVWGQLPPDPVKPPTTPNTATGGFNTLKGTLRVQASPDEYWCALGQNIKYAWIAPSEPCPNGQIAIPKVNQGYVWGSVIINGVAYFGTQSNAECIGEGALSNPQKQPNGPAPYQTSSWACEFGYSPYSPSPPAPAPGGPLPGQIGDQRPPRMYSYNLSTHVVTDITPKLGGTPGSYCDPHTGVNPLCVDQLWFSLRGVRTATSYTEPATGRTYLIVSGPALVQGSNALDFFAMDVSGPSSPTNGKWIAKYQYLGYNDMRHWITVNGVLYAPVGKPGSTQNCTPTPTACGGAVVRYTGNFATLPVLPVPGPGNNFNAIPSCGTTAQTIPPGPPGTFACFAFQDEGDFDGVGTDVVVHTEKNPSTGLMDNRLVVATWPPPSSGSLWMSPPIPAGGFTQNPTTPVWTKIWNYGTNYDPDALMAVTVGTGALADFCLNQTAQGSIHCPNGGTLYWGTMVYGIAGTLKWLQYYYPTGIPSGCDQTCVNQIVTNTFRTGIILNTNTLLSTRTINLLYGQSTFNVFTDPNTGQVCPQGNPNSNCVWTATPNHMGGAKPAFGTSGFGNPYNNYIWTMTQFNNKLYVGTMDWGYPAADTGPLVLGGKTVNITSLIPTYQYGADLWTFSTPISTTSPAGGAAAAESLAGQGNYLNYGIRAMLANGTTSLLLGTANPMNLATTSPTTPHGGWQLIEAVPGTVGTGR